WWASGGVYPRRPARRDEPGGSPPIPRFCLTRRALPAKKKTRNRGTIRLAAPPPARNPGRGAFPPSSFSLRKQVAMSWTRRLFARTPRAPRRSPSRREAPRRPLLEALEDRLLLSYPNVLVNNPSADTGSNDTQSETTLLVAGSTVVVGFNDS